MGEVCITRDMSNIVVGRLICGGDVVGGGVLERRVVAAGRKSEGGKGVVDSCSVM